MHFESGQLRARHAAAAALFLCAPLAAAAQSQQPPTPRLTLPPVIVTAQKEPTNIRDIPGSVTAVTADTLTDSGVRIVSDAALFAPNTFFTEFTARKASNPRFRGIGASPGNPAVTTYIDGVPQLNANSSSIELMDVDQIEFVRGPQSPLYGRNALGGIISVSSTRPSLSKWSGSIVAPFANQSSREVRGSVTGPLGDSVGITIAAGKQARDGFTVNEVTGNDVDSRSATFGKAQLIWVPAQNWEARVIFSAERDRDGDYALMDLTAARERPFVVQRDFEGYTRRDVRATTVMLRGDGERVSLTSSTGFVSWQTEDATDLDYTPLPLATRNNAEDDVQFTQEIRAASPPNAPVQLSDALTMKWQTGVMLFTQGYEQLAVNTLAPFLLSPQLGIPVQQYSPDASLDDLGMGIFGQAVFTLRDRLDLTFGGRFDHEAKEAVLDSYLVPAIAPATTVRGDESYSNFSPQLAVGYRLQPDVMAYASVSEGFKAGGWNPASPTGNEAYGEEHAWHLESGVKGGFAGGRVAASAAVFYIDWADLQLNVPNTVRSRAVLYRQRRRSAQRRRRVRVDRQAAPRGGALRQCRLHQRPLRRWQRLQRRRRLRQAHPEHAEVHGHLRRPRRAPDRGRRDALRPRRSGVLRRDAIRRCQPPEPGGVLAGQPARRVQGAVFLCRRLDAQRLRHPLRAGGLSVSGLRAVGFHR